MTESNAALDSGAGTAADARWTPWSLPQSLRSDSIRHFNELVPELAQPFVLRNETEHAKRNLFKPQVVQSECTVSIIRGPPESGKTSVAVALCRDPAIQALFPDGVIWHRCGARATPVIVLRGLLQIVRCVLDASHVGVDSLPFLCDAVQGTQMLSERLAERLAGLRCLLVLDDVHDIGIIRACNVFGPHLLVTTSHVNFARKLRTILPTSVKMHELRPLAVAAMSTLLHSHFQFQGVSKPVMDSLLSIIGHLPLESVLISILFQLVEPYIELKADDLVLTIMERLKSSHEHFQERLVNEAGAQHLSQSHLYCWRSLALTLELYPSKCRSYMLALAVLPPGVVITEQLLREIWQVPADQLPGVVSMFTFVHMLNPLRTVHGTVYYMSTLSHEYIVYWASTYNPRFDAGRLQKWLLTSLPVAAHVCNPFSDVGHLPLLRKNALPHEARMLGPSSRINSDELLQSVCQSLVAQRIQDVNGANLMISLALAAVDTLLLDSAIALLQKARAWVEAALRGRARRFYLVQIDYYIASAHIEAGQDPKAMKVLEGVLESVREDSLFGVQVLYQVLQKLMQCAAAVQDYMLQLSLALILHQSVEATYGQSTQLVLALILLFEAQLMNKEKPTALRHTLNTARSVLEAKGCGFSLLHLALERSSMAYYIYIGRLHDVEVKVCKLYMHLQQVFDPHHELIVLLTNDIALCLNLQGNFADTLEMLTESLSILQKMPSSTYSAHTVALTHNNLAVTLLALGRVTEAQKHVAKAMQMVPQVRKPQLQLLPTLYLNATVLVATRRYQEAKELLLQIVYKASLLDERSLCTTSAVLETLGTVCMLMGDYTGAENSLLQSLKVSSIIASTRVKRRVNTVETAKAIYLLSRISEKLGKHSAAKQYREKYEELRAEYADHSFMGWAKDESAFLAALAKQERVIVNDEGSGGSSGTGSNGKQSLVLGKSPSGRRVIHADPELADYL